MARIEESVEIKSPVDKVFTYTTDAKLWSKWEAIVPKAEQTSQEPLVIGTTFKGTVHMMGVTMNWTAEATQYEPNKQFAKIITSASLIVDQHNTYQAIDGRVKFTVIYDIKVRGIFKLFSPMLIMSLREALKKSLSNVKQNIEAQP